MRKSNYSSGPKFFGTDPRKSWFDQGDRCSPGPGTHRDKIFHRTNPPTWRFNNDTERDTFLEKHHYPYPPPNVYTRGNINMTHIVNPKYTIPIFELAKVVNNPDNIDDNNELLYKPKYHAVKEKYPQYSFGYHFKHDYSTNVPPPNAYSFQNYKSQNFNRTQKTFSVSHRPPPYGEQVRYPSVADYNVTNDQLGGTKYSVGRSARPDVILGVDSPGIYYDISKDIKQFGAGKTIGQLFSPKAKNKVDNYPAPNHYNSYLRDETRNIINYRSQRSQIGNMESAKYPSPQKYQTRIGFDKKSLSFTKDKRKSPEPDENPGVGSYKIEKQFNKTSGVMGKKLKDLTQFVTPSTFNYYPKQELTRYNPKRVVNCYSDRTDFTKSITGAKVGPGLYRYESSGYQSELGKMSKSQKFESNRNKNPGPGYYEIPNQIGSLPKYYTGQRKIAYDGFSIHEKARLQRVKRQEERSRQLELEKQKQEQAQQQQEEEKGEQQQEPELSSQSNSMMMNNSSSLAN